MAFPAIAQIQPSSSTTSTTPQSIALPTSTPIVAGDLILVLLGTDSAVTNVTFPSPWEEIRELPVGGDTTTARCAAGALVASGGETSVSVTFNTGERHSTLAIKIPAGQWHGSIADGIRVSTGARAGSGSPNPDALDLSGAWGSADTLFIAVGAWDNSGGGNDVTGWPTNYTGNQTQSPDVSSAGRVAIATRELASASDDPGAFAITSDEHCAFTIAIRPASTGAQTLEPPTIDSGATLAAPTVSQAVSLPTLATAASLFAMVVSYALALPTIASAATLFAPSTSMTRSVGLLTQLGSAGLSQGRFGTFSSKGGGAQTIAPPTITSGSTVAAPTLAYAAALPTIASGETRTAPVLSHVVALPAISSGVTLASPTITTGNDLALPVIGTGASLAAPNVAYGVALPAIAAGDSLSAPAAAHVVALPTLASGATLATPTLGHVVALPALASGSSLAAPTVTTGNDLALPELAAGAVLYAPALVGSSLLELPAIAAGSSVAAPTLAHVLSLPTIASGGTLAAPTLGQIVALPTIPSGSAVAAPTLTTGNDIALSTLASGASCHAPSLAYAASLPTLAAGSLLAPPTLASVVALPALGSTATLAGPALSQGAVILAVPTIPAGTVLYTPTLRSSIAVIRLTASVTRRMRLVASVTPRLRLTGSTMAEAHHIPANEWFLDEDRTLEFEVFDDDVSADPRTMEDVDGDAFTFDLRRDDQDSAPSVIRKTSGGGAITVTGLYDAVRVTNTQRVAVAIAREDTRGLRPATYYYTLRRDQDGLVLAHGSAPLARRGGRA